MNAVDEEALARRAEEEIRQALTWSRAGAPAEEEERRLWEVLAFWAEHPLFTASASLRVRLCNELCALLIHEPLRARAWQIITGLARRHGEDEKVADDLVIAIFEVFAEPPEIPYTLELLFSLAADPATRWAVLRAYERFPWRLLPHARKYSGGTVTDADCDEWLVQEGFGSDEYLISRNRGEGHVMG